MALVPSSAEVRGAGRSVGMTAVVQIHSVVACYCRSSGLSHPIYSISKVIESRYQYPRKEAKMEIRGRFPLKAHHASVSPNPNISVEFCHALSQPGQPNGKKNDVLYRLTLHTLPQSISL